jgi:hypothetical protein
MHYLFFRSFHLNRFFRILLIYIVVGLLFVAITSEATENANYDEYFYAVLDTQMDEIKYHGGKVLHKLYDLRNKSKNLDKQLVALLDYYIGAGPSVVLDEFITERGKPILPLLIDKKTKPLECLPQYKAICKDHVKNRNYDIDLLLDAIKKGIILK